MDHIKVVRVSIQLAAQCGTCRCHDCCEGGAESAGVANVRMEVESSRDDGVASDTVRSPRKSLTETRLPVRRFAIDAEVPPGTQATGVEVAVPKGWTVTAISSGGTYDAANRRIKWGPYFAPSIPAQVGYRVALPMDAQGEHCFEGKASFDGFSEPIGGDSCIQVSLGIPAVSTWGLVALSLFLWVAGTLEVRRCECLRRIGTRL